MTEAPPRAGCGFPERTLLALILLAALGLRLWGIGWGLPNRHLPFRTLHPDEAFYMGAVAELDPAKLDLDPKRYYFPSFLVYELAGWLKAGHLLGQLEITPDRRHYLAHPEDSAALYRWGRVGAALAGTLCVALAFCAGRTLYGERAGLWAAAFLAAMPLAVVDAHYVKTDTPQLAWILGALACSARFLQGGSPRWIPAASACVALAASNKYSALMAAAIPATALWLRRGEPGLRPLRLGLAAGGVLAAVLVAANPYCFLTRRGWREIVFIFASSLGSDTLSLRLKTAFEGTGPGWVSLWTDTLWHATGPLFELALAAALLAALRRRRPEDLLLAVPWAVFFLLVGAGRIQFVRYWLPACALSCLMMGALAAAPRAGARGAALRFALAAVLLCSAAYSAAMDGILARTDNRFLAAEWIERNVPPGTAIARLRHPEYALIDRWFPLPPNAYLTRKELELGVARPHALAWMPMRAEALAAPDRAPYLAGSSYELRDYPRLAERYPEEAAFAAALLSGKGYRVAAHFRSEPTLAGLRLFPVERPPHDWMYAWPEVWIFERSD